MWSDWSDSITITMCSACIYTCINVFFSLSKRGIQIQMLMPGVKGVNKPLLVQCGQIMLSVDRLSVFSQFCALIFIMLLIQLFLTLKTSCCLTLSSLCWAHNIICIYSHNIFPNVWLTADSAFLYSPFVLSKPARKLYGLHVDAYFERRLAHTLLFKYDEGVVLNTGHVQF